MSPSHPLISEKTLRAAVRRGLVTEAQVEELLRMEAASLLGEPQDDETFRFITGFADIFVTIGLGLFLGGLVYFAASLGLSGMALAVAAVSWLLAEFFTRRRRMALPSIVLLLVFAGMVFVAVYGWIAALSSEPSFRLYLALQGPPLPRALIPAALATVLAAGLHYRRFRVPITVAAGVAALVAAFVGVLALLFPGFVAAAWRSLLLFCGLAVFLVALRFDLSDPQRLTRRTDIAFWLHMLAAPLIVHSLIGGLLAAGGETSHSPWTVLLLFTGLGLVALLVDRRAILVSGLTYAGIAFGTLIAGSVDGGSVVPLTLLALGGLVLLLSAGWHALRRRLLSALPAGLARRLPHADMSRNLSSVPESKALKSTT